MEYFSPTYEDVHYKFYCYIKDFPAHTRSPLNFHEGIELLYITGGNGISHNDGEEIPVQPGDICVISARKLHYFETLDSSCSYLLLMPDGNILSSLGITPKQRRFVKKITDPALAAFMEKILVEERDKQDNYRAIQFGLITVVIAELLRSYSLPADAEVKKNNKYDLILPIIDYISLNYAEKLTSSALAKKFGISQSYLCHIFTESIGQSITEYINFLRCSKVRELITINNYSVSQAAIECGFSNLSYLTRTYKRYYGTLPSHDKAKLDNV